MPLSSLFASFLVDFAIVAMYLISLLPKFKIFLYYLVYRYYAIRSKQIW